MGAGWRYHWSTVKQGIRLALLLAAAAPLILTAQTLPPVSEVIEVRVIDVDVVVTDEDGQPVRNLTREDFELFENGKKVDITYFSRTAGGRLEVAPGTEGAPEAEAPVRAPVTWAVFFDQTNVGPERRNQALRQIESFFEQTMLDGHDHGLIASLDGLTFRIRQPATDRRETILEQLKKLEKEGVHRGASQLETAMLKNELARARSFESISQLITEESAYQSSAVREFQLDAQDLGASISLLIEKEIHRTRNQLRASGSLLDLLSMVDGRVVFVYVGAGVNPLPGIALTAQWRARFPHFPGAALEPRPEDHQGKLEQDVQRLFRRFSAMRVTLYSIHPGDLAGLATADDPGPQGAFGGGLGDRGTLQEAGFAREMAERTGGLSFRVNPSLSQQMAAVRRDLDDHYSLGYRPEGPSERARSVEVRVKAQGARARHREAVRESTPLENAASVAMARLVEGPSRQKANQVPMSEPVVAPIDPANPLGVTIRAEAPRENSGKEHLLPFHFTIGLDKLTFVRRTGALRAGFLLHFALVDRDGTVYKIESRAQSLQIPEANVGSRNAAYSWNVDLSPLRIPARVPVRDGMRLTLTVEDTESAHRSVVTIPVPNRG